MKWVRSSWRNWATVCWWPVAARRRWRADPAQGDAIDLVILDLIMPGMDGGKTFDRLRSMAPDMPVILASGYAINGQAMEIMRRGCNGFLQKPFNVAVLSQKICQVLNKAGGA